MEGVTQIGTKKRANMKTSTATITSAIAVGISTLHPLIALLTGFLALLIIADVISGVILASITGTVSSDASRKGLMRKAAMILVVLLNVAFVILIHAVEQIMGQPLGTSFPVIGVIDADSIGAIIPALCCLYEVISIIENTARIGVPWPSIVVKSLVKLKTEVPIATEEDLNALRTTVVVEQAKNTSGPQSEKPATTISIETKEVSMPKPSEEVKDK